MATRNPSTGMAHLTVVPENFEPAADDEAAGSDGADERASGDESANEDDEPAGNDGRVDGE
ncbi:hypothetical protein [Halosimplex sp. TS25]|uniref:hypothetical protein n=1 Tax=Halosimplex rarum TaxID=3396619 RepID=UPI0039EC1949